MWRNFLRIVLLFCCNRRNSGQEIRPVAKQIKPLISATSKQFITKDRSLYHSFLKTCFPYRKENQGSQQYHSFAINPIDLGFIWVTQTAWPAWGSGWVSDFVKSDVFCPTMDWGFWTNCSDKGNIADWRRKNSFSFSSRHYWSLVFQGNVQIRKPIKLLDANLSSQIDSALNELNFSVFFSELRKPVFGKV